MIQLDESHIRHPVLLAWSDWHCLGRPSKQSEQSSMISKHGHLSDWIHIMCQATSDRGSALHAQQAPHVRQAPRPSRTPVYTLAPYSLATVLSRPAAAYEECLFACSPPGHAPSEPVQICPVVHVPVHALKQPEVNCEHGKVSQRQATRSKPGSAELASSQNAPVPDQCSLHVRCQCHWCHHTLSKVIQQVSPAKSQSR